jgi:hypothetical protein
MGEAGKSEQSDLCGHVISYEQSPEACPLLTPDDQAALAPILEDVRAAASVADEGGIAP